MIDIETKAKDLQEGDCIFLGGKRRFVHSIKIEPDEVTLVLDEFKHEDIEKDLKTFVVPDNLKVAKFYIL